MKRKVILDHISEFTLLLYPILTTRIFVPYKPKEEFSFEMIDDEILNILCQSSRSVDLFYIAMHQYYLCIMNAFVDLSLLEFPIDLPCSNLKNINR